MPDPTAPAQSLLLPHRPAPHKRKKNLDSLAQLGITVKQAKGIVLSLVVEDYCSGPEEDQDRKGCSVWVFGTENNGEEIYIKLSDDFRGDQAKCISFHKAEFTLKKPYRK